MHRFVKRRFGIGVSRYNCTMTKQSVTHILVVVHTDF